MSGYETERRRVVFDVESIGLHGEGWAVGCVLLLGEKTVDESWAYCRPSQARGTDEGRKWITENCAWGEKGLSDAIRQEHQLPTGRCMRNPVELRDWFWSWWLGQKDQGAELWADVSWPVEARFLIQAVEDLRGPADVPWPVEDRFLIEGAEDLRGPSSRSRHGQAPSSREWEGPFPLLDIRSYTEAVLASNASDSALAVQGDVAVEVLAHHPLADARISARKLLRVEKILRQCLPA